MKRARDDIILACKEGGKRHGATFRRLGRSRKDTNGLWSIARLIINSGSKSTLMSQFSVPVRVATGRFIYSRELGAKSSWCGVRSIEGRGRE